MENLEIEKHSIVEMFEDRYKLVLNEKEKERILKFFKESDIKSDNVKIDVMSNKLTFINNSILNRTFNFNRNNPIINIDDVVFALYPMQFEVDMDITVNCPHRAVHKSEIKSEEYSDFNQNIAIIRTITFRANNENENEKTGFTEKYIILVYNNKLDVKNGIIFEDI